MHIDNQTKTSIKSFERIIGYEFTHPELAVSAFRAVNLSVSGAGNGNYFALFGKSALHLALDKALSSAFGEIGYGGEYLPDVSTEELSRIQSLLLSTENLASRAYALRLHLFTVTKKSPSKETLANLIYSLIGAVAIDSNWNVSSLEAVSNSVLRLNLFFLKYPCQNVTSSVDELLALSLERFKEVPVYELKPREREGDFSCVVRIPGHDIDFVTFGDNPCILEEDVASIALASLKNF